MVPSDMKYPGITTKLDVVKPDDYCPRKADSASIEEAKPLTLQDSAKFHGSPRNYPFDLTRKRRKA